MRRRRSRAAPTRRRRRRPTAGRRASAARTFTVDAAPPALVAAGDIAACDTPGDEATAELLDGSPERSPRSAISSTSTRPRRLRNCYDPTWGASRRARGRGPASHDYAESRPGEAYFAYFGAAAGEPAKGYYSYDIGTGTWSR